MRTTVLRFGFDIKLTEQEGHWSAVAEDLGLVVHGNSESEVRSRFREALDVLIDAFKPDVEKLRAYLDYHHVQTILTEQTESLPEPPELKREFRERWEQAVPLGAFA